jgi:hypothetical protein
LQPVAAVRLVGGHQEIDLGGADIGRVHGAAAEGHADAGDAAGKPAVDGHGVVPGGGNQGEAGAESGGERSGGEAGGEVGGVDDAAFVELGRRGLDGLENEAQDVVELEIDGVWRGSVGAGELP